jgi:hypothetical protein
MHRDGEPQAQRKSCAHALELPRTAGLALEERLAQAEQHIGRDAAPLIADVDRDQVARGFHLDLHRATWIAELDCVAQQIFDDAPHRPGIGPHGGQPLAL